MNKIELANKMYKMNNSRKKNARSPETSGENLQIKKDSISISSKTASTDKSKTSKKSPDIRMDLVNKYKADISKGTYKVKTNEIAEKIIQTYKEQIYHKSYS